MGTNSAIKYPEVGQIIFIRSRPAMIKQVETTSGIQKEEREHQLHLVHIEYLDGWEFPSEDTLIWEREKQPEIHSEIEFPLIESKTVSNQREYKSFVNAIKWSSLGNQFTMESHDDMPYNRLFSPWRSAIKVEDYQLVPVIRALSMHRVRMLLADGVGLGKTIQAGLITTELIYQRRIKKILIICPASLQE